MNGHDTLELFKKKDEEFCSASALFSCKIIFYTHDLSKATQDFCIGVS